MAHSIGGRASLEELLKDADRTKPVLLMDHQPLDTKEAASQYPPGFRPYPRGAGLSRKLAGAAASQCGRFLRAEADRGNAHRRFQRAWMPGSTLRSGCTAEFVLIDLQTH